MMGWKRVINRRFCTGSMMPSRRQFAASLLGLGLGVSEPPWILADWLRADGTVATESGGNPDEKARNRTCTDQPDLEQRILGMLLGTLIGDAAGGPVEFHQPQGLDDWLPGCRNWEAQRVLTSADLKRFASSFRLLPYAPLRPEPSPYGQWTPKAMPGTVTDDTRHKIILLNALRAARDKKQLPIGPHALATAYLHFSQSEAIRGRPAYKQLCRESLLEFSQAARWVLGQRDPQRTTPPERLWGGLDTCCGQMTLLPLAAIYAGQPVHAYRAAYALGFTDNGPGKDINSALVAGLAAALGLPTGDGSSEDCARRWQRVVASMKATDPYRYAEVPWVPRPATHWLKLATQFVERAAGRPGKLYALLEQESQVRTYWEAHFIMVLVFSMIEFCQYDSLSAMQLVLDFGHDTDSGAQLLGAFVGALEGPEVFPETMRTTVRGRLMDDYDQSVGEWVELLLALGDGKAYPEVVRWNVADAPAVVAARH